MYHCHVRFYFIGRQRKMFEQLKRMPPLECFSHEFLESDEPEEELAVKSDLIVANLQDEHMAEAVRALTAWKKSEAELILLADQKQAGTFTDDVLSELADIWMLPMPDAQLRFHFLRWQQARKTYTDYWQTSQYLEATINSVPNLIWYKDKHGIHEKVNDSFCDVVGKSKMQVQGRGHAYIWDVEKDDPACIESERLVMERRETRVSEETIQTGEGDRLLTTYKSPLYDWDGSVMGTVGVAIDVTRERAYAEEVIKKSQTLETIFTTMDCGIMCHSIDGSHILSINRAALNLLGYESQEELTKAGFNFIAPSVFKDDREKLRKSIESLKNAGDNVSIEYRVQRKDGELIHLMGNVKLMEENGELFYQRYLMDCTAQKLRQEEERKAGERRQRELIQALSIEYNIVCYFDLDTGIGRVLRLDECEDNFLQPIFSGTLSLEECMGRYIDLGVHEDDRETLREMVSRKNLKKELLEKDLCQMNYRTTYCGETRYFQIKIARAGEWDVTQGVVVGMCNVDEATRSEMEKTALLKDALSQANRANKAKSTFLSNMSHDIRTPMNAIIGFTTLAISHIDRQEQVEGYLKKIMTSSNHLLSLINDILDMSRIESGKFQLDEQPCSLPDILHGLRNIIQADIHSKQLDFYMDAVNIQNENICCDRLRLNQILLNLLNNAIKYTGAGGMVSLKVIEKSGAPIGFANYEFHIKDTGIGMSEEFVTHIFEPFERERNSTVSGIQGTGLGMAITKNIVDMMNGSIEVKSEQNIGTECIVYLTFRLHSEKREPQTIPELNGLRALVVDDDFNSCDSVSYMLKQIGLRAEWTLSGKEAILRTRQAIMRDDQYFVYIIDWLLPDMNGLEVTRRIRQETGKDVPIIVLTAYDWTDIEEEARDAGVTAFCSKPLFLSELYGCLNSIVHTDKASKTIMETKKGFHTGRILLAEDNDLNQEIAMEILGEAGFYVEVAENGSVAVDMLENSKPGYYQLVLMDIQMPVMNGYDAAKEIRRLDNEDLASIPIFAMTANAFEEDKQEALRCGMDGHIAKPIDIEVLINTLDEVLKGQQEK